MDHLIEEIIKPETDLEKRICNDPEFRIGMLEGKPRKGHPEGQIIFHVQEVLKNIEAYSSDNESLRLIAIIHDTFKYKVDRTKPRVGENHHGMIARRFAEKYDLPIDILDVIELHDEAYNIWKVFNVKHKTHLADERAKKLLSRLGNSLRLFAKFYRCDNKTGNKSSSDYDWFMEHYYKRKIDS